MKKIVSIFCVVLVLCSLFAFSVSAIGFETSENIYLPTYENWKTLYSNRPDVVSILAKVESCDYWQEICTPGRTNSNYGLGLVLIGSSMPIKYVDDIAFLDKRAEENYFYIVRSLLYPESYFKNNTATQYAIYKGIDSQQEYYTPSLSIVSPALTNSYWMCNCQAIDSNPGWFGSDYDYFVDGMPAITISNYSKVLDEGFFYPVSRGSDISKYPDLNSNNTIMDIFLEQNFSGRFDRNLTGVHITPADPENEIEGDFSYITTDGKGVYTNLDTFGGFIKTLLFMFKHPPECPDTITLDNNNFAVPIHFVVFRKSWFSGAWFSIVRGLLQCAFLIAFVFFVVRQLKLAFAIETQIDNGGSPRGGGE